MSDAAIVPETDDGSAAPPAASRTRAPNGTFSAAEPVPAAPAASAAPAAAPARVPGSIATGAEVATPPVPQDWPADWAERMARETAGDDDKVYKAALARIKRYASPPAVWAKAAELETKLGKGGLVQIPGPKATDEEKAAYFKATGVPEKADEYGAKIKLSNNRVLGEADKPVLDSLAARLHPLGVTPGQMSALVDWKLDYDQAQNDQREEDDGLYERQSEIALRKEIGNDQYKPFTAAIGRLINEAPPEVRDIFAAGRDPNGNKLGNHPALLKWLGAIATELVQNGENHGDGGNNPAADELAALRQKARDKPNDYTKADEARQTQLIEQQQGRRGRRAA